MIGLSWLSNALCHDKWVTWGAFLWDLPHCGIWSWHYSLMQATGISTHFLQLSTGNHLSCAPQWAQPKAIFCGVLPRWFKLSHLLQHPCCPWEPSCNLALPISASVAGPKAACCLTPDTRKLQKNLRPPESPGWSQVKPAPPQCTFAPNSIQNYFNLSSGNNSVEPLSPSNPENFPHCSKMWKSSLVKSCLPISPRSPLAVLFPCSSPVMDKGAKFHSAFHS